MKKIRLLILLTVGALALLPGAAAAAGTTERVSVDGAGAQASGGDSAGAAISADGRFVAFYSYATNLVAGDSNGQYDIFVRDRSLGTTELVSVDSAEAQATSHSFSPAISADGRFVAFHSEATNLVAGDSNVQFDIFVRDRTLGTTERVSVDSAEAQATSHSFSPAISADGRFVAFHSGATNLVAGDSNATADVFVRDRSLGTTERVSVDSAAAQANSGSLIPDISADGLFVAFQSIATNLVAGDSNGFTDIFVRDRTLGTTERVSVDSAEVQSTGGDSGNSAISGDGRFVAFHSGATDLVAADSNVSLDIFVRDRSLGTTERVSVDSAEVQSNGGSAFPAISADGRFVAFQSIATNLVAGDSNDRNDVFVHDRTLGATGRVSVDSAGAQATGGSSYLPAISADGRFVAFESSATNLVAGDSNARDDVFVRAEADSDGDGIADFIDNCPTLANADGQLADADGDTAGDACDAPGTGNVDCSNAVNSIDALKVLRYSASLPVSQNEPCADIGTVLPSGFALGDVDCSGGISSVDALKILRVVASLPVSQVGCAPLIGPP